MRRRRPPMNIDNPVEFLTHPEEVRNTLLNYPEEQTPSATNKRNAEFYPALTLKEGDQ